MHQFTIHHLRITAEVQTPLALNEHKGSAIRGALFHALRGPERPSADGYTGFCTNKAAPTCWECSLHAVCPVSKLVATLADQPTPQTAHGHEAPRPYIIRPPLEPTNDYQPGDFFTFTLGLCADALQLFPFVILALERLAHDGLGKRTAENNYQRGRLATRTIHAIHPLTGETQSVRQQGQSQTTLPNLAVTHADVLAAVAQLPHTGPLTLRFKTPTRLIHDKKLLKQPHFRPLLLRLITRLEQLSHQFSPSRWQIDVPALLALADQVTLTHNHTRWEELESYSTRTQGRTNIGGLLGTATYSAADWRPFLPWLVWGTLVGVGKNTVKGDGWFELETHSP